jgi:spermidine/putrescine transport system substrate-binding protein
MNARFRLAASVATASLGLLLATSCGSKKPTLYLYNWDAYLSPDLVAAFEAEHGCSIVQDVFDSNEMLEAKMKGGAADYDVVFPSSYFAARMFEQGMIQKLDRAKLPNLKHVDAAVLAKVPDTDMVYSVPYMVGCSGLAYLKSQVPNFEPSWTMLARADLQSRTTLLNDIREVLGAALKTLGYSNNSADPAELKKAAQLVMEWKKIAAKFDNEQYKNGIASGEFKLVHGYVCDLLQVAEENKDIEVVLPREGTQLAVDLMVIPAKSRNPELAHAFINFLHEPENAAANTEWVLSMCPNSASYDIIDPEVRANKAIFPDPEVLAKSELLRDVGAAIETYNRLWDAIKSKDVIE